MQICNYCGLSLKQEVHYVRMNQGTRAEAVILARHVLWYSSALQTTKGTAPLMKKTPEKVIFANVMHHF